MRTPQVRHEKSQLHQLYEIALAQVATHLSRNTRPLIFTFSSKQFLSIPHEVRAQLLLRDALIKGLSLPPPKKISISFEKVRGYTLRERNAIMRSANGALVLERKKEMASLFQHIGIRRNIAFMLVHRICKCPDRIKHLINTVADVDAEDMLDVDWQQLTLPPDQ